MLYYSANDTVIQLVFLLTTLTQKDLYKSKHTPWKTNMEPENHLFEQEDHLNQTSILGRFKMSICQAGGNSGQEINAKTFCQIYLSFPNTNLGTLLDFQDNRKFCQNPEAI